MSSIFKFKGAQKRLPLYYILHGFIFLLFVFSYHFNSKLFRRVIILETRVSVSIFATFFMFKTYFISTALVTLNFFMTKVYITIICYQLFQTIYLFVRIFKLRPSNLFIISHVFIITMDILEIVSVFFLLTEFEKNFLWADSKMVGFNPEINGKSFFLIMTHIKREKNCV